MLRRLCRRVPAQDGCEASRSLTAGRRAQTPAKPCRDMRHPRTNQLPSSPPTTATSSAAPLQTLRNCFPFVSLDPVHRNLTLKGGDLRVLLGDDPAHLRREVLVTRLACHRIVTS